MIGRLTERTTERRAARIVDPVERLRFLRRQRAASVKFRTAMAIGALAALMLAPARASRGVRPQPASIAEFSSRHSAARQEPVWLVERQTTFDLYSNGLRIETGKVVPYHARQFTVFAGGSRERATRPAGIVYHSTESHILPFRPDVNRELRTTSASVLDYVRRNHAYHYLIDRFGTVHAVVDEASSANHAGNSVWGSRGVVYTNLNHAFLGVAFETHTDAALSPAQIHSGKVLTALLLNKYGIPGENCVTHAQVSVNPSNRRLGWHTDWARNFPFGELGLPRNYELPLTAITEFGYSADAAYLEQAGEALAASAGRSEEFLSGLAEQRGEPVNELRRKLQRRFDALLREENHEY